MIFLLCFAFNCALHNPIIQLVLLLLFPSITSSFSVDHSIDPFTRNYSIDSVFYHSIDLSYLNHAIDLLAMPVTTRSKAKGLSHNTLIADSSDRHDSHQFCTTAHQFVVDQGKKWSYDSSIIVHDFENCCSSFQNSETSNFQNYALVAESLHSPLSHNLESPYLRIMESDCEEILFEQNNTTMSNNQDDILKMLTAISQQMMTNYQDLQQQIAQTDMCLSTDLSQIVQDNESFKHEIRQELLLIGSTGSSIVPPTASSTLSVPTTSGPPVVSSNPSAVPPLATSSNPDFQNQMMVLLNETFSHRRPKNPFLLFQFGVHTIPDHF
jgi:hypothetical protein